MAPTVSVIMPAYNVERYIAESIESVLAQTYTDYELVIVNDGSLDNTLAIAERYAADHPEKIHVISQENRGLAGARNTGLRHARGAIFALLDSDDIWMPSFLASQMDILDANPAVAIVTGNGLNLGGPDDGKPFGPYPDARPSPDLLQILGDETAVFIMTLFRRTVVNAIGEFDEHFRTNEDYDFWIRAAAAGFTFARNPRPLARYRRHANSLSASDVRMLNGILRVYRKALASFADDPRARAVIERQIARFDAERLKAEARAAIDAGDIATAVQLVDALRVRRGGFSLAMLSVLLRNVPRAALWAYRARRHLRTAAPLQTSSP
jgi:glycosyltransferase involved in cell wall biosynthesis